ncbi:DUF3558 domain-containing protein [Actinophytocola gossypii]|uniref:DUF3558 domain-containing protein n=1 Tax=Actinophytocola gossypii TaxID=2812003 RepID=A0ABT2J3E1_9PSEU|nr:DUF3558 domain-containing protein [Actinophytocola gossypii]MCT2582374.1 DUF3558 domain-containing protein [Actinophytocola gossypii]
MSLAFVTLAGTACSTDADGTPIPQTSSGRAEESRTTDPSTDPEVENPLDASRFLADPCAVLTQTQLAAFDVTRPGIPETTGSVAERSGPFCVWHAAAELGSTIGVGFITGNKDGLSDIYRGREQFEDFRPVEVDQYPAVFANSPDLRSSGMCTVYVGISDTLAFRATEGGQLDASGSCDRAKQVAAAALTTIQEAR